VIYLGIYWGDLLYWGGGTVVKASGSRCAKLPAGHTSASLTWLPTTTCLPAAPRYMETKCDEYWQGDLESALRPHPVLIGTSLTPTVPTTH
jgi:hypothetical protein